MQNSTNWKFTDILLNLGLNSSEAKVYELLLKDGEKKASVIATYLGLSRVIVYRILDSLVIQGVIEKNEHNKGVTTFTALHPSKLVVLLEKKKQKITQAELELNHNLGAMASEYNLAGGKPNVQFFEGKDAIRKITSDYPKNEKEILQWMDLSVTLPEISREVVGYLKTRIKYGISKRMIVPHNDVSIRYAQKGTPMTEFRVARMTTLPTVIQVYDNTVAMLTFGEKKTVGVLMQDPAIAQTLKSIFNSAWDSGRTIDQDSM